MKQIHNRSKQFPSNSTNTGSWQKVKLEGPAIKAAVHMDETGESFGLSKAGCELYPLDVENMKWLDNINTSGYCFRSVGTALTMGR